MRVIAGGYSKDNLIPYSREQQDAFNVPGVSDVSLIWNVCERDSSLNNDNHKNKCEVSN